MLGMLSAFRFIRDALQVEENLSQIHKKAVAIDAEETEEIAKEETEEIAKPEAVKEFLHDEVRDKLEQIGLVAWPHLRTHAGPRLMQLKAAKIFRCRGIRRTSKEGCENPDMPDIVVARLLNEVAYGQARQPPRGCIHHSDRGSQYACEAFCKLLANHGFIGSMGRRGNPYDNAKARGRLFDGL